MRALANHHLIAAIERLAGAGKNIAEIAESVGISEGAARRVMRAYGIKTRTFILPIPRSAPMHKLMGGR